MNERIKELRKTLGFTQQEFADKIGVKRNTVATYEMGRSVPSDSAISLICREFNVREAWLRTGEGEMFKSKSRNEELMEFATTVAEGDPSSIQSQLLAVMSRLTDEQWEVLAQVARDFAEEAKNTGPQ